MANPGAAVCLVLLLAWLQMPGHDAVLVANGKGKRGRVGDGIVGQVFGKGAVPRGKGSQEHTNGKRGTVPGARRTPGQFRDRSMRQGKKGAVFQNKAKRPAARKGTFTNVRHVQYGSHTGVPRARAALWHMPPPPPPPPRKAGKPAAGVLDAVPAIETANPLPHGSLVGKGPGKGSKGAYGQLTPVVGSLSDGHAAERQSGVGEDEGSYTERQPVGGEILQSRMPARFRVGLPNSSPDPPNIYIFVAENVGSGKEGIRHSGNTAVQTPTLDAFARSSIDFVQMHTPMAMSMPSRAALFSGLYPFRNGAFSENGKPARHVRGLPHTLRPLGYRVVAGAERYLDPSTFAFERYSEVADSNTAATRTHALRRFLQDAQLQVFQAGNTDHKCYTFYQAGKLMRGTHIIAAPDSARSKDECEHACEFTSCLVPHPYGRPAAYFFPTVRRFLSSLCVSPPDCH